MKVFHNNNNLIVPEVKKINVDKSNSKPISQNQPIAFKDIFSDKISESTSLQFSKHANMRLNSREITLSNEQIKRVEDGVEMAKTKGINDSLVLVDNVALLVNTKNKMVITALNKEKENLFTNIDGAVIV